MDQAVCRRGDQRARHLDRDLERRIHWQRTFSPNERLQRFAFDQLHRVIAAIRLRRRAELKNTRHIGMPQGRGGAGLAQKTFPRCMCAAPALPAPRSLSAPRCDAEPCRLHDRSRPSRRGQVPRTNRRRAARFRNRRRLTNLQAVRLLRSVSSRPPRNETGEAVALPFNGSPQIEQTVAETAVWPSRSPLIDSSRRAKVRAIRRRPRLALDRLPHFGPQRFAIARPQPGDIAAQSGGGAPSRAARSA